MLDDGSKAEKRKKDDVTNVPNGVCYRSRLVCLEMAVCMYVCTLFTGSQVAYNTHVSQSRGWTRIHERGDRLESTCHRFLRQNSTK